MFGVHNHVVTTEPAEGSDLGTAARPVGKTRRLGRWIAYRLRQIGSLAARHLVDLAALVALLIVLSHATFTTPHEQLARYSGVLSDLCLALLAAWVFNLLVVELPRRRDREQLYTGIAPMVGLMANAGIRMVEFLSVPAGVSVAVDPSVGGVIVPADRGLTDRICAVLTPTTRCGRRWSPGSRACGGSRR